MIDIDKLEAGPQLDALIAEKVFGVKHCVCERGRSRQPFGLTCRECRLVAGGAAYSFDVFSAWQIVDKINGAWSVTVYKDPNKTRVVLWDREPIQTLDISGANLKSGDAESFPLAICRAALKAVGA